MLAHWEGRVAMNPNNLPFTRDRVWEGLQRAHRSP